MPPFCPVCHSDRINKDGMVTRIILDKYGRKTIRYQSYRCKNGHTFKTDPFQSVTDEFAESVVYVYLRCLSLNTTVDIVRMYCEEEVISKRQVLEFIETVADVLPSLSDIDVHFSPKRSGYVAIDGVWFSYNSEEIVLLVAFDPVSFDIIVARWATVENEEEYNKLIRELVVKLPKETVKGIYGDGDLGLLRSLNTYLPNIPFQLCIVHKELRMGMLVPVKSVGYSRRMDEKKKEEIREFQKLFRSCIYVKTKKEAKENLVKLGQYVQNSHHEMFKKAYRSLAHNFELTLTHFDHPHMERDNNLLECFNGILKPRLNLMKSFKKKENLDRYLKLFLLEFRFRPLKESSFKERRNQSPLELGDVFIPQHYNFITLLRTTFNLHFVN